MARRAATLAILGAALGAGMAVLGLMLAFGFGAIRLQSWPAWASAACLVAGAFAGAVLAASIYLAGRRFGPGTLAPEKASLP